MSSKTSQQTDRLAELRRAFDESFAEAPGAQTTDLEELLVIRVGATPHALRLAEISGLLANAKIVGVPTASPDLLGIAGVRGSILPVYDLALMLGYPAETKPRWLVIAADKVACLAFSAFESYLRVPRGSIVAARDQRDAVSHVRQTAQFQSQLWPIVSIVSAVQTIRSRVHASKHGKE